MVLCGYQGVTVILQLLCSALVLFMVSKLQICGLYKVWDWSSHCFLHVLWSHIGCLCLSSCFLLFVHVVA